MELRRGAWAVAEGRLERLRVHPPVRHLELRRPVPAAERFAIPGAVADPRRAVQAELPGRRRVGQPPEVIAVAVASKVDRADRMAVEVGLQVELDPGRPTD